MEWNKPMEPAIWPEEHEAHDMSNEEHEAHDENPPLLVSDDDEETLAVGNDDKEGEANEDVSSVLAVVDARITQDSGFGIQKDRVSCRMDTIFRN